MTIRTYDSNYLSKASRALGAMLHDAVYRFGLTIPQVEIYGCWWL